MAVVAADCVTLVVVLPIVLQGILSSFFYKVGPGMV